MIKSELSDIDKSFQKWLDSIPDNLKNDSQVEVYKSAFVAGGLCSIKEIKKVSGWVARSFFLK